jgi:hypothetical protein
MNSEPTIEELIRSASAMLSFINDVEEEWNSFTDEKRADIVKAADDGTITVDDLKTLVRRHVYMLVTMFSYDVARFLPLILDGIRNRNVAMTLIVETVRIMDALMPQDYNTASLAPEIREKYCSRVKNRRKF